MIPISTVRIDEEIEAAVLDVLRSGMIAQGPKVAELENVFAKISGVKHAVAVNNGTTALVAVLKMLDVPKDSTVITSPFTFVATLNAAVEAGFKVRFADVDEQTFNITAETISAVNPEDVSTVMPVHLYGQCADMTSISAQAAKNGWAIVEDAAQAHAARHNGQAAGSFGAGCFSFYATKNITTGEGGIITTNDDALADRLRIYRNQGMRQRYQYEMAGTNYRMTDVQAAIGIPQLKKIDVINASRQKNAEILNELLAGVAEIATPVTAIGNSHVWHQYTIRVLEGSKRSRDEVIEYLTAKGVGCGIYYPRLAHDYECFQDNPNIEPTATPVAARLVSEVVSLPVHQYLSLENLKTVASEVKSAVQG
jgi:dTDP-4-amino-4,6-dideoxygalactose transaminase